MGLVQVLREEGKREGKREGLLEAIDLGISLRYGERGLSLMDRIAEIKDNDRLIAIKEAIKTTDDLEAFKRLIEGFQL